MTSRSDSTAMASITATINEIIFTVTAENAADSGFPAPSSLLILTLIYSQEISVHD